MNILKQSRLKYAIIITKKCLSTCLKLDVCTISSYSDFGMSGICPSEICPKILKVHDFFNCLYLLPFFALLVFPSVSSLKVLFIQFSSVSFECLYE